MENPPTSRDEPTCPHPRDMSVSSLCSICWDIYDDAVLAKDGFCYCRACIVEWAQSHNNSKWPSPITREEFSGHPVLRTDVERNCVARELKRAEVVASLEEDPTDAARALQALSAVQGGRPVLDHTHCLRLLQQSHPVLHESPYVHLAVVHRAGCLELLPVSCLKELLRLDRHGISVPLLQIRVLKDLFQTCCAKVREAGPSDAAAAGLMRAVLDHLTWRVEFRDAVDVPEDRVLEKGEDKKHLAGRYCRDWSVADRNTLVYLRGNGVDSCRQYLFVPLQSDGSRGTCERILSTRLALSRNEESWPPFSVRFSSEEVLVEGVDYWRARRGGLPFPDSRGLSDTEEESAEMPMLAGCEGLLEKPPRHLPIGFEYRAAVVCEEHVHELNALKLAAAQAMDHQDTHALKRQRR